MKDLSDAELATLLDKDIFHKISAAADKLQLECYVVGGYVRDLFLERPSNDIDVVVVGSGIKVADELKNLLGSKAHISIFRNFGTAQVSGSSAGRSSCAPADGLCFQMIDRHSFSPSLRSRFCFFL